MRTTVDAAFADHRLYRTDDTLEALLRAARPEILRLCRRILAAAEDVEDASQRVLLEVAEHAAGLPSAAAFRGWLSRVCMARASDVRRRITRRRHYESNAQQVAPAPAVRPSRADDDEEMNRALATLSEEERELLLAYYFDRVPLRTLAERRGVSKVAVWKRLERTRRRLRRALPPLVAAAFAWLGGEAFAGEAPSPRPWRAVRRLGALYGLYAAGVTVIFALGVVTGNVLTERRRPMVVAPSGAADVATRGRADGIVPGAAASNAAGAVVAKQVADVGTADALRLEARAMFRNIQRLRRTGEPSTPDMKRTYASLQAMLQRAEADPRADADVYADLAVLLHEEALDECGRELPAGGRERMDALRRELAAALRAVPASPAAARHGAAVEANLAFARGVAEILPPTDETMRMLLCDVDRILRRGNRKSWPLCGLHGVVVRDWTRMLDADPYQQPLVADAARVFVARVQAVTASFEAGGDSYYEDAYTWSVMERRMVRPYDPVRRMEHQLAMLRAQMEALERVEPVLRHAQRDVLNATRPWDYALSRNDKSLIWQGE